MNGERSAPARGPASVEAAPGELDLGRMEPQVEARLLETRSAALAEPLSAEAWGRYGMVAHAHELWDPAASAYRQAERIDPTDVRWPYFLGDVASVEGTDLEQAVAAFQRALALRPNYAPAHMRLGKVLIALDRNGEAAAELERALELEPGLQPARVALAQVRLAQDRLEAAQSLLETVLETEPRHGQALTTLGRVYMRLGRRDQARQVAERARDAASYNLFDDPLMAEVVAEGVSSVQIWERAKGFLEQGNYPQAILGLRQVVELQPDNAEAHLQLAVSYGTLGDLDRSRVHLERAIALEPEPAEPRLDLARILLARGQPGAAVAQLERARRSAPDHPEVAWWLGRARLESGNLEGAVEAFGSVRAVESETPAWVHTAWGRALAQTGKPAEALRHFRAALVEDATDAEALFYAGLVLEGLGRVDEAVASYCRSRASRPGSPAVGRLQALGRDCL